MQPWTFDLNRAPPRIDYYAALAWIGRQVPSDLLILEAGTFQGHGARALSQNGQRPVHTWDITAFAPNGPYTFHLGNALDIPADLLQAAGLVYLDVDPHDGLQEPQLLASFLDKGFRGLCACDDIFGTPGMKRWWASVTLPSATDDLRFHGGQGIGFLACSPDITLIGFSKP